MDLATIGGIVLTGLAIVGLILLLKKGGSSGDTGQRDTIDYGGKEE